MCRSVEDYSELRKAVEDNSEYISAWEIILPLTILSILDGGKPKAFPRGLVAEKSFVYEIDPDLIDEINPHGVGLAVGKVLHPHGDEIKCLWLDCAAEETTPKKFLKRCPQIGDVVNDGTYCYTVLAYLKEGVKLKKKKMQKKTTKATKKSATKAKKVSRKKKKKVTAVPAEIEENADNADWLVCRASGLQPPQVERLQQALKKIKLPPKWSGRVYEVFAERTLRQYKDLQKSLVHANCEKVLRAAVAQVMEQVRPVITQPYDGDVDKATVALTPALLEVSI